MTESFLIHFHPFNTKGKCRKGTTLFQAALELDVPLRSDCGQKGTCGKCRVQVNSPDSLSPLSKTEKKVLSKEQVKAFFRLACQAEIYGPADVTVPEDLLIRTPEYGKTGISGSFSVNPAVKRFFIPRHNINQTDPQKYQSVSEQIRHTLFREFGETPGFDRHHSLKELGSPDMESSDITVVNHDIKGVVSILKGEKHSSLGIALDIGTTTIAAYLCDLETGRILASNACSNPQQHYGEDVISRIAAVRENKSSLSNLRKLAADAVNELITSFFKTGKMSIQDIDEVTIAGNTTMQHILSGLNPSGLGIYPYLPVTRSSILAKASDLNLTLSSSVPVYFFPVVSGFLGGDILAAFLADQPWKREETTLIIDVGTNGELILCSKNGIWATSCATGPALEGAQISCGMRASAGAVNKVFFNPDAENPITFETIENADPAGICGSGIIDAVAAMRKADIIKPDGTFNTEDHNVGKNHQKTGKKFFLPDSGIFISLKDIRQFQLAKAALFTGIQALVQKTGITEVDHTILTGAFGSTFNWSNARDIGMLPQSICKRKVSSARNLAGTGAAAALFDKTQRAEIEHIAEKVRFIDLASEPDFTEKFSSATRFPE